jgi:hypothetical protein
LTPVTVVNHVCSITSRTAVGDTGGIGAEGINVVAGGGLGDSKVGFDGGENWRFTGFVALARESKVGRGDEG